MKEARDLLGFALWISITQSVGCSIYSWWRYRSTPPFGCRVHRPNGSFGHHASGGVDVDQARSSEEAAATKMPMTGL